MATFSGFVELNSADPGFKSDPYSLYASLRSTQPIARVTMNGMPGWLVTSYDLVRDLLADLRLSSDPASAAGPRQALGTAPRQPSPFGMLTMDPPDHTRLRSLVNKAFTPRRVERLRPRIQKLTDALLDEIQPGTSTDLVTAFAHPLPLTVIMEILGMEPSERGEFEHWVALVLSNKPETAHLVPEGWAHIHRHLHALVTAKSGNDPESDLLSALVSVRDQGDRLSQDELVATALVLLLAGHSTTADLIGNGVLALCTIPGLMARAQADLGQFLEELLRFSPSIDFPMTRFAAEDLTITPPVGHPVTVTAGEPVFLSISAANRDPARFPGTPEEFDAGRDTSGLLTFGLGRHYCVGASLARLEAEIAFTALLARFSTVRLAVDLPDIPWTANPHTRGPASLPVVFTA